jgi:ferric-dicitrate binding protein FerR (iron transport regulator)
MDKEKLQKLADNQMNDRQGLEEVIGWIEASPDHQKEFSRIKNRPVYESLRNFEDLLNDLGKTSSLHFVGRKIIRLRLLRYAAIFILAFLIGGSSVYFLQVSLHSRTVTFNEIIVPLGESTEVILADQTRVWLNSGARLSCPSGFRGKIREVSLTGEAFFEVTHNSKKPFHVVTPNLTVNVLGTTFNVEAYPGSEFTNVTLVEGKVNIEDRQGRLLATLSPSENASYDANNRKIELSKVSTDLYTSWREGTILFKDEKLTAIAKKIERWYNVEIVFDDEPVRDLRFTGSILKNKPVDQIMQILKYTSGVDYTIDIREKQPNIIHLKKMPMK